MDVLSEVMGWLDENVVMVMVEDFEEQKERLLNVVYFIISKLYVEFGGSGVGYDDELDIYDELQKCIWNCVLIGYQFYVGQDGY